MADGQLMLAVAQFGVIGINRNTLLFQGGDNIIHHFGGGGHGDGTKTEAGVDGDILAVIIGVKQAEFVF